MSILDWIIIIIFLGVLITIGFMFSKKNKDIKDYFLAGKSMPTWLVVLAATGTSVSAGTFVGSPELGFNTNITYIMSSVGSIIGGTIVAAFILPKLYNTKSITIYGYIGDRFGETSKRATSVIFILGQLLTSGSRLFIASIAVSVIIFGSIQFDFLIYSIIILGIVSTVYTMAGGIKGLLYIDAVQIMLVIGTGIAALLIVFFTLHGSMSFADILDGLRHGMVKAPGQAAYGMNPDGSLYGWIPGSKIRLVDPRFRFDVPYNLVGALVAYAFFRVAMFSTDYEFVQRQLTCKSVKSASMSLIWSQFLTLPIVLVFLLIGGLLFVRYINDPGAAIADGVFTDARDIFPQFICHHIPIGVRGLMVVGLLAAALSSFNSAINAMASSFVSDLYLPIRQSRGKAVSGDANQMAASKKMVLLMGFLLTMFSIVTVVMQQKSGLNLVDFATGVMCFSYAGMMGVFMTALFTKRGSQKSVIAALVTGLIVVLLLQPFIFAPMTRAIFGHEVFLAWPWWCPISVAISFAVCLLGRPKTPTSLDPAPAPQSL
ncbi:MAG: sodium:solute symporter [Clostridia bacterium]|nr:sodium:solute symporter [Clostridia bacterium]